MNILLLWTFILTLSATIQPGRERPGWLEKRWILSKVKAIIPEHQKNDMSYRNQATVSDLIRSMPRLHSD